MEKIKQMLEKIDSGKFINLVIALAIGVFLLIASNTVLNNEKKPDPALVTQQPEQSTSYESNLERKLKNTLSLVEGAGRVEAMITLSYGKEIIISKDITTDKSVTKETDSEGGSREVILEKSDVKNITISENGTEKPLILKEIEPKVLGVIIVAEGGNDSSVKDALTKSAMAVLGVEAHKVQVLKMK